MLYQTNSLLSLREERETHQEVYCLREAVIGEKVLVGALREEEIF